MDTIECRGRVQSIEDAFVVVSILRESESQCDSCGLCGGGGNSATLRVPLGSYLEVTEKDIVDLRITSPNPAVAAAIVFGIPLLAMIAGAGVGYFVAQDSDLWMILGGVLGIVSGAGIIAILERNIKSLQRNIAITKVEKAPQCMNAKGDNG